MDISVKFNRTGNIAISVMPPLWGHKRSDLASKKARRGSLGVSKVFIVEDHPVVRKGYVAFLTREPDLEICGEAASGAHALEQIRKTQPDLVVLDVSLQGDMNGVELLKRLHQEFPKLPVLVVSGHDEAIYGDMMKENGAWDYVMKGNVGRFIEAVRAVLSQVQTGESSA